MIYLSPKFILLSLSGIGVTAGGVAVWWLNKKANPENFTNQNLDQNSERSSPNSKEEADKRARELTNRCGEYIKNWADQESKRNNKSKNFSEYLNCSNQYTN